MINGAHVILFSPDHSPIAFSILTLPCSKLPPLSTLR